MSMRLHPSVQDWWTTQPVYWRILDKPHGAMKLCRTMLIVEQRLFDLTFGDLNEFDRTSRRLIEQKVATKNIFSHTDDICGVRAS